MSFAAIHAVRNSTLSPAPNAAMSAPAFRPGTQADTVFIPFSCAFAIAADIRPPAQRRVVNAAGPDRAVPADHDVAHSLAARPRLIEPRTLGDRHEVALVGVAARLPEAPIESCRQVARLLGRDSCGSELS